MRNPWIWIVISMLLQSSNLPWGWCSRHNENDSAFYLERDLEVCVTNSDPLVVVSWIVRNGVSNLPNLAWGDKAH